MHERRKKAPEERNTPPQTQKEGGKLKKKPTYRMGAEIAQSMKGMS